MKPFASSVNEYAKFLRDAGEVLRKRTPRAQKTAIGYFPDRIEVLTEEGIARRYFFDTPRPKEADYLLPESSPGGCVPQVGAEGGTRTPTAFPPPEPESGASASSATSAIYYIICGQKSLSI